MPVAAVPPSLPVALPAASPFPSLASLGLPVVPPAASLEPGVMLT